MKERFRQKEIPVTEAEIKQAVEGWWGYLDRKMRVHPHLAKGIVPRLIDDYGLHPEETRTVKFSLVDTMAPELAGLGKLANAKEPHVYVEGTINPNVIVKLEDLYPDLQKQVFRTDPTNLLLSYLFTFEAFKYHNLSMPDRFLLYIYTADDIGKYGKTYESPTVREMIFYTTKDEKIHAYDLKGGWRRFRVKPLLDKYTNKSVDIKPVTQTQIAIVQESFRDAISQLSLVK